MLNKFKGVLDAARNVFTSDPTLVRQGLSGLEVADKARAARAAAFVVSGDHPEVLLELQADPADTGSMLGQPGRLRWRFNGSGLDEPARAAARASLAARHTLYQRATQDATSIALLVRLGKVLDAADHGRSLEHTGAAMPTWLQYLLNDALWASHPADAQQADPVAARPAWDVALVAALLAHDGFHPEMTLPVVFERNGIEPYAQSRVYLRLLAPGALDDYLLAQPDAVAAVATVLSAAGRVVLVNRLGASPALLAAFGNVVVKLAVGESSTVRAAAASHVATMAPGASAALLHAVLGTGVGAERGHAADLLARMQGEGAIATLEAALATEPSKSVQQTIRTALSRVRAADDAGAVDLPEPPPLPPEPTEVLGDDAIDLLLANHAELLVRLREGAEEEIASNREAKYKSKWRQNQYDAHCSVTQSQLRQAVLALNGKGAADVLDNPALSATLALNGRLEARADFGLLQVLRWIFASTQRGWSTWQNPRLQAWLRRQDPHRVDMRQLATVAEACGDRDQCMAMAALRSVWGHVTTPQMLLPAERVWPLYAARPALIDEGLGLAPRVREGNAVPDLGSTLEVLATFPLIPPRWMPRLLELALGEGKTHRAGAQQALARMPDIGKRVAEALGSNKQELRTEAARWLAQLDDKAAVPALNAALAKETRETVSAALLTALEALGEDMGAHLAPARLLAQARKGLKGKAPAGMAWLNLDAAPACAWLDGSAVEPELVRWWVILACKLKEPGGNALLERYLGLLASASRAALGRWVLHQFIARDTMHPPLEDGIAWAQSQAAQRYQDYQHSAQRWPQYYEAKGKLTPDQVFEEVKHEKMAEYLGSAIGEKGLLALVWGTPGAELVGAIQTYMRDHYQRRAQVEALMEAAAVSDQPSVIQFVLSIARRYRTASVQEKARLLVQRIAERNGWTADQLADRTVPTGGLDDSGTMVLQYGSRQYTVTLDAALKPVLRNEEGKTVAALPAARQDDAPAAIKEGKQLLSNCKKELKQVLDMQGTRLYEAMCAGRAWPVAEWREFLLQHPVVGRLVQRLVWLEATATGLRAFRPTEDGSLIDAADDEVVLGEDSTIRLAHASLLSKDDAAAWIAHCKDYKVTPLFAQMTRPLPLLPTPYAGDTIDDRLGWVSDAFTLRGAFNKLGYQRGAAEDGGVFYEYRKDFGSTGLAVVVEFSGNGLPEENVAAALKTLSFQYLDRNRHGRVALAKVPTILLAEAYADYHTVAAACSGFDANWEKKMPW
jgi:hypothetical protein